MRGKLRLTTLVQLMSKTLRRAMLIVAACSIGLCCIIIPMGFDRKGPENSWEHFKRGGMFVTSTASGTSDGEVLVYASACTGRGDIYFIATGGTPKLLTNDEHTDASPILAPDVNFIAFCRERNGWRHIWIMDTEGENLRQITVGNNIDDPRAISNNGKYIHFFRSTAPAFGHGKSVKSCILDIDDPENSIVEVGIGAAFSPDSRFVVFTENWDDLWKIDLGSSMNKKHPFPARGYPVGFSSDGRYLLTTRLSSGSMGIPKTQIWIQDLETNIEKQIGDGHSAAIGRRHVGYIMADKEIPVLADIESGAIHPIPLPQGIRSEPRVSLHGDGLLFNIFVRTGDATYDIVSASFSKRMEVKTLANVRCGEPGRTP